jgi:hypothetical protein
MGLACSIFLYVILALASYPLGSKLILGTNPNLSGFYEHNKYRTIKDALNLTKNNFHVGMVITKVKRDFSWEYLDNLDLIQPMFA